jgi:serine/threonine-protein kinase
VIDVGSEIAGYRIERLLGQGGMGAVYEATQLSLKRTVALKVLLGGLAADDGFRRRFQREGEAQAAMDHPNIVPIYDSGTLDDGLYIAMRLVRGPNLKHLIENVDLEPTRALALLRPIAEALDAAHVAGLVHRDVKPQNILVGPGDHPYLADFGLTKGAEDMSLTETGEWVGSIHYVSPEQIRGETAVAASDVYALAAVVYECMSGEVPYNHPSEVAVLYSHVNDPPPDLARVRPDLPPALGDVITRGMAKDPVERPPSAVALVDAAAAAIGDGPATPEPVRPPRRLRRRKAAASDSTLVARQTPVTGRMPTRRRASGRAGARRGAAVLVVAGVALVLAAAVGAFLVGRGGGEKNEAALDVGATNGTLSLRAPDGWRRQAREQTPEIPGLGLSDRLGLVPDELPATGTLSGMTGATGATLLPRAFRKRLAGDLPRAARVRLGAQQALMYRDLRVRGFDRLVTVFAVPTTLGVATLTCYAPEALTAALRLGCERVAQTLRLRRGRAFPLGPDPATARALDDITGDLNRVRRVRRGGLKAAKSPAGQRRNALALARAQGVAARRAGRLDVSPAIADVMGSIAAALRAGQRAYTRVAAAVSAQDAGSYRTASKAVRAADRDVDAQIGRLADAGYRIGHA